MPDKKRRKSCPFSKAGATAINYRDVDLLREFIDEETGRLMPARKTGVRPRYQRMLAEAIKRARFMALLPYAGPDPNAPPSDRKKRKPRR